jgi:hypothetical protein
MQRLGSTGLCVLRISEMRDRRRYLQWVFEAKKRFGLSVLNYMVTSNHVHLLVKDTHRGVSTGGELDRTNRQPGRTKTTS